MSSPYRVIACCVDRTSASLEVERRAADLAESLGSRLHVVHVMRPALTFAGGLTSRSKPVDRLEGELRGEAAAWLMGRPAAEHGAELTLLEAAVPGEAICGWAATAGISLAVAGRSERGHPRALGSTATYLGIHAPCDVLLVDAAA